MKLDISTAKSKISQLTDPGIKDVGNLLLDLGLELIACDDNGSTRIIKDNDEIGKLDLVYKDDEIKRFFIIEVSTRKREASEKIDHFFSRWEDTTNIDLIKQKFSITGIYKISRVFFELTAQEIPSSVMHKLENPSNSVFLTYDLKYFLDAYRKIGKWAKNDLYSFMRIEPPKPVPFVDMQAMQYYLGDVRAYLYLDRVDRILNYCYIFRRIKNDKGYQRILEKGRIGNIAKKIESGRLLAFPNAILISSTDDFQFNDNPASVDECPKLVNIRVPNYYCACRIVDGQHRLLGFANLGSEYQESHSLPIIALENIDLSREMKTFIDINSTQKKIDRNLILTLEADFQWNKDENKKEYFERQAVLVIKKLNKVGKLKGRIYIPEALETRKGKITLSTLVSAIIGNHFIGGRLHLFQETDDDIEVPYRKINEIFILLAQHLPNFSQNEGSYFQTNKGLRMLFRFLQIFERNKVKGNIRCNYETLIKDLKKIFSSQYIKKLDIYYGEGGANKAAEKVWSALKRKIKRRYKKLTTNLRNV